MKGLLKKSKEHNYKSTNLRCIGILREFAGEVNFGLLTNNFFCIECKVICVLRQ